MQVKTAATEYVRIVDQQSPWVGCTVSVLTKLEDGRMRVRVSELVIVGLEPGEYRPTMSAEDREYAWQHAANWAQGTQLGALTYSDEAIAYADWYSREYVTDAETMSDLPSHSHVWPRYLDTEWVNLSS